jgi:hypothetical protein
MISEFLFTRGKNEYKTYIMNRERGKGKEKRRIGKEVREESGK